MQMEEALEFLNKNTLALPKKRDHKSIDFDLQNFDSK